MIANQQGNLSIVLSIIEGKVKFYDSGLLSGTLEGSELSINDCLTNTKEAISNYREFFNAQYCNGFDSILPSTIDAKNTTLNNANLTVNIQVNEQLKTPLKCIITTWRRSIDNMVVKDLTIQSTISKTGVITSFIDNLGVYEIATTDVSMTKEVALKTAMPYIEEYATVNERKIEATDVTLAYVRDLNGSRGDSTLIYPQWCVSALFDSSEDKDVYGFNVLIWADNGVVGSAIPQAAYHFNNSVSNELIYLTLGTIAVTIFSIILFITKKRKT
ncbi:MAG: hypothetical protein ACFCUE_06435 [Candidatus Bathyarchaeia archaeon]|jgi:Zn-dependent metalloprotease